MDGPAVETKMLGDITEAFAVADPQQQDCGAGFGEIHRDPFQQLQRFVGFGAMISLESKPTKCFLMRSDRIA